MRELKHRGALVSTSAIALLAIALSASPSVASAAAPAKNSSAKATCLAAHEAALSLRSQKKPHAALEQFVSCSRTECPAVVRKECIDQAAQVEKDTPTVALEAHDDDGKDTTAVKVSVDGSVIADKLTGAAVDVEPGEHVFRFERADGKSIEQRVLVVEGEKNRKVVGDFASLVPKPIGPNPADPKPRESKPIPVLAYVAGGVAIAALGSFGIFALSGKSSEKNLASSCEPNCKTDQLTPVKRDYLIADISLVVAVLAAAGAVLLVLPSLSPSPQIAASNTSRTSALPAPWLPHVTWRSQ
jgi:hypothetical protein